jgi:hypothetical protein
MLDMPQRQFITLLVARRHPRRCGRALPTRSNPNECARLESWRPSRNKMPKVRLELARSEQSEVAENRCHIIFDLPPTTDAGLEVRRLNRILRAYGGTSLREYRSRAGTNYVRETSTPLGHRSARDNSALIQLISMLLASAGARTPTKSGLGRLSSINNLTEKTLRNRPNEYKVSLSCCQSPTCQSPSAIIKLLPLRISHYNSRQKNCVAV